MFVSDGKSWKPQKIELRAQSPDGNGVNPGEVLLKDKDGKPVLVDDPTASAYIEKTEGKGKTEIPVVPWKDVRTPNVIIVEKGVEVKQ